MNRLSAFVAMLSCVCCFGAEPFFKVEPENPLIRDAIYDKAQGGLWAGPLKQTMADVPSLQFRRDALTITCWVVPDRASLEYRQVFFKSDRSRVPQRIDFKFGVKDLVPEFGYMDEKGAWHGILRNYKDLVIPGKGRIPLDQCAKVKVNYWNFMAVTFDRGFVKLFLNGEKVSEGQCDEKELFIQDTPLRIGHGEYPGGQVAMTWNGLLDQVAMYNTVLSEEEIEAIRGATPHPQKRIAVRTLQELYADEYDPKFTRKLDIVKAYEAAMPENDLPETLSEMSLVEVDGVPRVARNGKIESVMCMMPECGANNDAVILSVRDFAAADVDYVSEIFWPWLKYGACNGWWLGPGEYDFEKVAARIDSLIAGNPKARLIIRWKMNVPDWWLKAHPEEIGKLHDGNSTVQPSMASERWIADVCVMLRDMTAWLEGHPRLGRHVMGYLVAGGSSSEWFWWGYDKGMVDYSEVATRGFRSWLGKKYADDAALQSAWESKDVTLKNAEVPSPRLRFDIGEDGCFRAGGGGRHVYDFRRFMSDTTTDCISRASAAVRSVAPKKLIGTFYGYSMSIGTTGLANLGFQNLDRVLEDKNIDFYCAPISYGSRRGGQEGHFINLFTGSLKLHGRTYWDEADLRTHLCHDTQFYRTLTPFETSEVNWRTFGNSLAHGTNIWWFLIAGNGSFHSNQIMGDIKAIANLDRELIQVSRKSAAEVALICDERSLEHTRPDPFLTQLMGQARTKVPRIGVAHDTFLMSDIYSPKMRDYKLYIFLNAFHITDAERAAIHERLARNNAGALWMYGAGYLSPAGNSVDTMAQLTGLSFEKYTSEEQLEQVFADGKPRDWMRFKYEPGFALKGDVRVLVRDGERAVAGIGRGPWGGLSAYSGVPLDADLVRGLCRELGIHVYVDSGDIVQANTSFVMVHSTSAGDKTLRFPKVCTARNLRTGEVRKNVKELAFPMQFGETKLFEIKE